MSTDYSYLSLETSVTQGHGSGVVAAPANSSECSLRNPMPLFFNADKVYSCTVCQGYNAVTLWSARNDGKVARVTLTVKWGCKVSARSVVDILDECASTGKGGGAELFARYGFPAEAVTTEYSPARTPTRPVALRTYTSTSALCDIIAARLAGHDSAYSELVIAAATAVPAADEADMPRLRTAPMPDFEVETPAPVQADAPAAAPAQSSATVWEEDEEEYVAAPPRKRRNAPVFIALALVALAAGWAIVHFLPSLLPESTNYSDIESTDVTELALRESAQQPEAIPAAVADSDSAASAAADTVAAPAPEQPAAEQPKPAGNSADEAADIEYLNNNKVWKRAQLKSEKYRGFFDLITEGDLAAIAESEYFAVAGKATNKDALKFVDLIWQAKGTDTDRSNRRALTKLKGKGEIDMHKLVDTLARYRSPKPNNSPRPKR